MVNLGNQQQDERKSDGPFQNYARGAHVKFYIMLNHISSFLNNALKD